MCNLHYFSKRSYRGPPWAAEGHKSTDKSKAGFIWMLDPKIYTNTSPAGVQESKNKQQKWHPEPRPDWCWCISLEPALEEPTA